MLTSARQESPLLPRYRRLLSIGDTLDESIQLFRARWITFAVLSAVTVLPPGLLRVWLSASGVFGSTISLAEIQSGGALQVAPVNQLLAAGSVDYVVSAAFFLLWSSAIVIATDVSIRGGEPRLLDVYARALRRYLVVGLASILVLAGLAVLVLLAMILLIVTAFGTLGSLAALVAALFWWLRPSARKTWLKWLIILAAPFGLPAYFLGRWSMYIPAAVLERESPIGAPRRSGQLVDRDWLRVMSILTVAGLIVGVLQWAPATMIEVPLTISSATRGQIGLAPAEAAVVNAVAVVLEILFASIGSIVYTLVFTDLRNRREGTDIVERLRQLESGLVAANG